MNLETDFNSEIEKSVNHVYSLLNRLKERKIMEFTEFKRRYNDNYEKIKKDFFDLKFKFSKFYMKNEAYFFTKNTMTNLSKNEFDHTISDVIYLINMDLLSKIREAELALQTHLETEKKKVFGHKEDLHDILIKFNSQLQSLIDMNLQNDSLEKVFPDFTKSLDVSLNKFSEVFEDLNKAYVNIKNSQFTKKFDEYLTKLENDFLIKYFSRQNEEKLFYKGAAYEKKRLLSAIDGMNALELINKEKKTYDWELNYNIAKDASEVNYLQNSNRGIINRDRLSMQMDENKSKSYFLNFLNNADPKIFSVDCQERNERSSSPAINRIIRASNIYLNDDEKNFMNKNIAKRLSFNDQNNIQDEININKGFNNTLNNKQSNKNMNINIHNIDANANMNLNKSGNNFYKNINAQTSSRITAKSKSFMEPKNMKNKLSLVLSHHNNRIKNSLNKSNNIDNSFNLKNKRRSVDNQRIENNNNANDCENSQHIYNEIDENYDSENTLIRNSSQYLNKNSSKQNYQYIQGEQRGFSRSKSEININLRSRENDNNINKRAQPRNIQELGRSASMRDKNLSNNSSSRKLLKNSSSFIRSSLDSKRTQEDSIQLKFNKKNKRLSNMEFSDEDYNNKNNHNKHNISNFDNVHLNNNMSNNNNNNEFEEIRHSNVKNIRHSSQINIKKSRVNFFEDQIEIDSSNRFQKNALQNNYKNNKIDEINNYNKNCSFNNSNNKHYNINLKKIHKLSNEYINKINKSNTKLSTTDKKSSKNYNIVSITNKKASNNKNIMHEHDLEIKNNNNNSMLNQLSSVKLKILDRSEKKNFKSIQVVTPQIILNVFQELIDSKESNNVKPFNDKDYYEKLKKSIEYKFYLLKKFFILLLLEKFGDYDDKDFSNYCSNYISTSNNCKSKFDETGSNMDYDILLNENHLENLSNIIIPKVKATTNQILIFNRKKMAMYKHYVPLSIEEHGISYFLDGCRYIVANERIYISGGRDEDKYYSTFLEYDYIKNTIKRLSDMCMPRAYHKMLYCHNKQKLYILGGENNKSCEFYDFYKQVCYPLPNLNEGRSHLNAYITKDGKRLYAMFGLKGKIYQNEYCEKIEILNLEKFETSIDYNNLITNNKINLTPLKNNNYKISEFQNNEISKLFVTNKIFSTKWEFCEYKNYGDLDLKFRYVGVYPLDYDILLLIGGCLYREINLMIAIFNLKKNDITKIDEDTLSEIMRRSKDDTVLMKVLAEINRNIYK